MGKKKKGTSGKRVVMRIDPQASKKTKKQQQRPNPEPEKTRIPERIQEKDSGFGVIKVAAGVIIALIVASMILFNQAGGQESIRGDKLPGESCQETSECAAGSICYSYKGSKKRCMTRCSPKNECNPGYTCISATQQKRRKGLRLTDICVENAQL
ncbi:MAG: hypothetical protein GY847_27940 [Proteobacteria bacterium]|nr:hypothetical protein [Pseudomonadota bacterium]